MTRYRLEELSNIYIAHQNTSSLDEVQRMTVSYLNNYPIAVEGYPGTGKNHCIDFLAEAFGKKLHRVRCTEEMVARDIIGGDKLVVEKSGENLATKTGYGKGRMINAMEKKDFLVLDEFNQLLPSVQKGFNSALEDLRTIGSLEGNYEAKAKPGFGLFITYNPDTGIAHEDLESAIKDRCKLIHFDMLPADMQVYLALMKSGSMDLDDLLSGDGVEVRGLRMDKGVSFVNYDAGDWRDANGDEVSDKGIFPYLFIDCDNRQRIDVRDDQLYTVTRSIVNVMKDLTAMRRQGTVPFMDRFEGLSQINTLNITPSSPRIISKLVKDYKTMEDLGVPLRDISSDLALSVIDYAIQPGERDLQVGDGTSLKGLVYNVCAYNGLLTAHSARKMRESVMDAATFGALKAFEQTGLSRRIAFKLVSESLELDTSRLEQIYRKEEDRSDDDSGFRMREDDDIPF